MKIIRPSFYTVYCTIFLITFLIFSKLATAQCVIQNSSSYGYVTMPNRTEYGESFLVNCSGSINQVSFGFYNFYSPTIPDTAILSIYDGADFTSPVIYSQPVKVVSVSGWVTFNLTTALKVTSGKTYSAGLYYSGNFYASLDNNNHYSDGCLIIKNHNNNQTSPSYAQDILFNVNIVPNCATFSVSTSFNVSKCPSNFPYTWNNKTYAVPGVYKDTFKTSYGCDSFVTMHLTMKDSTKIIIQPSTYKICSGSDALYSLGAVGDSLIYQWQASSYNNPTIFSNIKAVSPWVLSSATTDTLKLTSPQQNINSIKIRCYVTGTCNADTSIGIIPNVVLPSSSNYTILNCGSYNFNGKILNNTGVYIDTLKGSNSVGCDSIVYLTLGINVGVSGQIISPLKKQIHAVNASLLNSNIVSNTFNGKYSFPCINGNTSDTIELSKLNDSVISNGVSTLDLALVQSHVLGKGLLNSPYKIIAADVNGDGKVTALDVVYIKRLILGLDSSFKQTSTGKKRLWVFIDSSYKFPDTTNPFPFHESIILPSLLTTKANQTFIGVKLGDVNWDWNPALAKQDPNSNTPIQNNINENSETFINQKLKVIKKL